MSEVAVPQSGVTPVEHAVARLGHRPVLDGLRGIAILLVLTYHTSLLPSGFVGVDVFFGLSGFLITTLLLEEWGRAGQIDLRRFYVRRARRLMPALIWVVAAVCVVGAINAPLLSQFGWPVSQQAAVALTFTDNWVASFDPAGHMGVLNQTWSLAQEEQFYLLWPPVLLALLRARLSPQTLVCVIVLAIVVLLSIEPGLDHILTGYNSYFSPLDRAAELLLGCLAAVVWHHRVIAPPSPRMAGGLAGALIAVFIGVLAFDRVQNQRFTYLVAIALAVPIMYLLICSPQSLASRLIGIAPLRYIGKISYCMYLVHMLIRALVDYKVPQLPPVAHFALVTGGSVAVASVSWWLLESRVIAGGRLSAQVAVRSSA